MNNNSVILTWPLNYEELYERAYMRTSYISSLIYKLQNMKLKSSRWDQSRPLRMQVSDPRIVGLYSYTEINENYNFDRDNTGVFPS